VKISSRIISHSASKFLILKRFDRHNKVILFMVTIFVASCGTGGAKPKSGGTVAPPAPPYPPHDRWLLLLIIILLRN